MDLAEIGKEDRQIEYISCVSRAFLTQEKGRTNNDLLNKEVQKWNILRYWAKI